MFCAMQVRCRRISQAGIARRAQLQAQHQTPTFQEREIWWCSVCVNVGHEMDGKLKIDELVSRTFTLEQVNEAYEALKEGGVARSVVKFF